MSLQHQQPRANQAAQHDPPRRQPRGVAVLAMWLLAPALLLMAAPACRKAPPAAANAPADPPPRELVTPLTTPPLAPGLWVDPERQIVEFTGAVAIDVHHPDTPHVYLELFVCSPDTREHESLVVTDVKPSLIHAALLAAGFEPGKPGSTRVLNDGSIERTVPKGPALRMEFLVEDDGSSWTAHKPSCWVRHRDTDQSLQHHADWKGVVFVGSTIVEWQGKPFYDADGSGLVATLVGFDTIGAGRTRGSAGVVAAAWDLSEAASIDEPVWIADADRVPARGTQIRVRFSPRD